MAEDVSSDQRYCLENSLGETELPLSNRVHCHGEMRLPLCYSVAAFFGRAWAAPHYITGTMIVGLN